MKLRLVAILLLATMMSAALSVPVRAQTGQVRVVYFTSPVCSFCLQIEERDLPPLEARYGEQLYILRVDTTTALGQRLFQTAWDQYAVPAERRGTPTMIVNGTVLVGAGEIPAQLPGLVADLLVAGGNDWPAIPGLEEALEMDAERKEAGDRPLWLVRFERDLPGNYISVGLLILMLALAVFVAQPKFWRTSALARKMTGIRPWIKVGIALVGLGVAVYLSYVETTQLEAWCGPVGQCNVVQQSRFASLFGFLPMALFGALGYTAVLATYIYGVWIKGPYAGVMPLASFLLTAFGFIFSIWLTYLQPFVIGATCMWCLASAVTMTLSMLSNAGPGWGAVQLMQKRGWRGYLRTVEHGGVAPASPVAAAPRRAKAAKQSKRRRH